MNTGFRLFRTNRLTRITGLLTLAVGLIAVSDANATTVLFTVTDLGSSQYRFHYTLTDFSTFPANQVFEVQFDPTLFTSLSNGTASPDFSVFVLQPNNPVGAPGIYSAMALVANPSMTVGFGVDAVFVGPGVPGSQPFFIYQFDIGPDPIESGQTVTVVPEPASWLITAAGVLGLGLLLGFRNRRRQTT